MNSKEIRPDQELIQRSITGDQEAYGDLYERYLDPIYRYIYYRVDTVEEAEDLTELVFIKVWQDLRSRSAKNVVRNFKAWLYRVAHNQVVDHYRKHRPEQFDLEELPAESLNPAPGTEEAVLGKIDSRMLAAALRNLEEPAQKVIILRFLNGMSHAETAAALDLKEGHVRVIQYRALKHLREILNEENHD